MRIYLRIREVKERIDVWLEANEQIHFGPKKSWVGIPVPSNAVSLRSYLTLTISTPLTVN